jgi:hypothetical protein
MQALTWLGTLPEAPTIGQGLVGQVVDEHARGAHVAPPALRRMDAARVLLARDTTSTAALAVQPGQVQLGGRKLWVGDEPDQ